MTATDPNASLIEALFKPTARFRDLHGNRPHNLPEHEVLELLPGLSFENVRATGVTWEDFCLFLEKKIFVWMTPGVFVCSSRVSGDLYPWVLTLGCPTDTVVNVYVGSGTAAAAAATATATYDFLVCLMATSGSNHVYMQGSRFSTVSGAGLSLFFQDIRDNLQKSHVVSNDLERRPVPCARH
jgi:hypothetical protein